jgi:hypothetical protein
MEKKIIHSYKSGISHYFIVHDRHLRVYDIFYSTSKNGSSAVSVSLVNDVSRFRYFFRLLLDEREKKT